MLSRVADAIYWMEKYRERAENTARFIDVNLYLNLDLAQEEKNQWDPIIRTTGDYKDFFKKYGKATEKRAIDFLTFDEQNPNSIISCLIRTRENARSIRELISPEYWREINTLYLFVRGCQKNRKSLISYYQFYDRIKRQSQLVNGLAHSQMLHGEAWHFGRVGYLLERADKTSRVLDVKYFILLPSPTHVGSAYDNILWAALLKSASGFEMYRIKSKTIQPTQVLHFLVLDPEFPRSIFYCVENALESLKKIGGYGKNQQRSKPEAILSALKKDLESLTPEDIVKKGVHEFLNEVQIRLNEVNESVYRAYFAPYQVEQ